MFQLSLLSPDLHFLTTAFVPLSSLTIYMLAFGVGAGTVPWTLLGELVPAKVRHKKDKGCVSLKRCSADLFSADESENHCVYYVQYYLRTV